MSKSKSENKTREFLPRKQRKVERYKLAKEMQQLYIKNISEALKPNHDIKTTEFASQRSINCNELKGSKIICRSVTDENDFEFQNNVKPSKKLIVHQLKRHSGTKLSVNFVKNLSPKKKSDSSSVLTNEEINKQIEKLEIECDNLEKCLINQSSILDQSFNIINSNSCIEKDYQIEIKNDETLNHTFKNNTQNAL